MFTQCVVISKLCVSKTCTRVRLRNLLHKPCVSFEEIHDKYMSNPLRSARTKEQSNSPQTYTIQLKLLNTHSPNTTAEQSNLHVRHEKLQVIFVSSGAQAARKLRCPFPPVAHMPPSPKPLRQRQRVVEDLYIQCGLRASPFHFHFSTSCCCCCCRSATSLLLLLLLVLLLLLGCFCLRVFFFVLVLKCFFSIHIRRLGVVNVHCTKYGARKLALWCQLHFVQNRRRVRSAEALLAPSVPRKQTCESRKAA